MPQALGAGRPGALLRLVLCPESFFDGQPPGVERTVEKAEVVLALLQEISLVEQVGFQDRGHNIHKRLFSVAPHFVALKARDELAQEISFRFALDKGLDLVAAYVGIHVVFEIKVDDKLDFGDGGGLCFGGLVADCGIPAGPICLTSAPAAPAELNAGTSGPELSGRPFGGRGMSGLPSRSGLR